VLIIKAGLFETTDMDDIFKEGKKKGSKAVVEKAPAKGKEGKEEKGSTWQKFKDWLEEEEVEPTGKEIKKEKPAKKEETKNKKEETKNDKKGNSGKGALQKFKDWLEEE
jgi:hypothetical protein